MMQRSASQVSSPEIKSITTENILEGYAEAQFKQGQSYEYGESQDYIQALHCYQLAAEQGYADAQFNIGKMYENEKGVKRDYQEALRYYQLAANNGCVEAVCHMAKMYEIGLGVHKNKEKAIHLYQLAKEDGSIIAKMNLARIEQSQSKKIPLEEKKFIPTSLLTSHKESVEIKDEINEPIKSSSSITHKKEDQDKHTANQKESVESKDEKSKPIQSNSSMTIKEEDYDQAEANFKLGVMYDKGLVVPQDYKEAIRLYCLAADQGFGAAQNTLG